LLGKIVTDYLKEDKPQIAADLRKAEEKAAFSATETPEAVSAT
jgi:hypothetical protein